MSFLSQPVTLQSIFGSKRTFGPITVQVVLQESTNDTVTITKQPVQTGASTSDHAYKEPTTLSMQLFFQSDLTTSLSQIYQQLLDLQFPINPKIAPFTIITPKRKYTNMLISSLGVTTDKNTENILSVNVSFQQVLIVSIGTVQVDPSNQSAPQVTQATQPTGKKSALFTLFGGG